MRELAYVLALLHVHAGLKGTSSTPARVTSNSGPYKLVNLMIVVCVGSLSAMKA